MDWRAVGAGTSFALAHVWALALPMLAGAFASSIALVPVVGVAGGAAAGVASADCDAGGRHGLLAGALAGLAFAAAFLWALSPGGPEVGAFWSFNYLLATTVGRYPVLARNGHVVVPALAAVGALVIAAAGWWAGRAVGAREEFRLVTYR